MFPIRNCLKQADALSSLFFIFVLDYSTKRVQINRNGWKLNGTNQVLFCADGVIILDGRLPTIKEHTEALVVASKEMGLEVNADRTMYRVISRDQNSG
jgi:hypothetical protein